jgi:hypothetical protein
LPKLAQHSLAGGHFVKALFVMMQQFCLIFKKVHVRKDRRHKFIMERDANFLSFAVRARFHLEHLNRQQSEVPAIAKQLISPTRPPALKATSCQVFGYVGEPAMTKA